MSDLVLFWVAMALQTAGLAGFLSIHSCKPGKKLLSGEHQQFETPDIHYKDSAIATVVSHGLQQW